MTNINKELSQKITVTADHLNIHSFTGIKGLFTSELVEVWLEKDRSARIKVLIESDTIRWSTKDKFFDLSITIIFEPGYDFFHNVRYS